MRREDRRKEKEFNVELFDLYSKLLLSFDKLN
jgi:hypothetical protein